MKTRAKWAEEVENLYPDRLNEADSYFGVPRVAELTGLSPNTITDLLSRPQITSRTNVLWSISRPDARIGNQPLYSQGQVDEVVERQRETGHRHLGGGTSPLASITPTEAKKRNLVSVEEIAALANIHKSEGMHEQTVRRWARECSDFPPAVALESREGGHPGVPRVVRDRKKVIAWLIKYGYRSPERKSAKAS